MRYYFVVVYCLLAANIFAQKASPIKKAQQAYEQAAKHLRLNELDAAIDQLQTAVKLDNTFATVQQQLGDIYRKQEDYKLAASSYLAVLQVDSTLTPLTYFGLGESLLFTGNYQEASIAFKKYQLKGNLSSKSAQLVSKYLLDCEFSIANISQGSSYLVTELPKEINSPDDEYFPQLTADNKTLIFTRKTSNQENFYESRFVNKEWTVATKLPGQVNSESYNEGAHCISPDGKYLYFTGCNRPNGFGSCDIYVSKKVNGTWSAPHNIGPSINSKGWEAQPSISADGKTLYFVSNRAGGFGGYDLYQSKIDKNGNWSPAVNLGKNINSPYNESAPYIHADNQTLYFASDGWPGFGRKDIFKSTLDTLQNWSVPYNLGHPINNHQDQMSMHVSMNSKIAHLSSQDSMDRYNIYALQLPLDARPMPVAYVLGTIIDANSKKPLQADISVTNTNTQKLVFTYTSELEDGKYLTTLPIGDNYAVHIQKEGYLFDSKQYALHDKRYIDEEFIHTTYLSPIQLDALVTLNNIYFDINEYELLPTSLSDLAMLKKFLTLNPKISIEVSGHTDNTGNKQLNQVLSENRAQAVVNYLIKNHIDPKRLKPIGYGDNKPIADNASEEGKRLNRRTEIKIVKTQQ